MLAVAIISSFLGMVAYFQRQESIRLHEYYERRAEYYRECVSELRQILAHWPDDANQEHGYGFECGRTPALRLRWRQYYETIADIYNKAANRPWDPLPPLPPKPEVVPAHIDL